jgi:ketosteroid isomerase-like protein
VVHDTADPEVIVGEFDYHGQVSTTGRTFQVPNIQVLRIRDGQIVSSRDYHDHLALAAAVGRLQELVSSLADRDAP